jgi:nucleotide-binding universal stress UspA family protein
MTYSTILVHIDFHAVPEARVRLAADLADRFDARLIGFAAHEIQPPVMAEGMVVDGGLVDELIGDIELRLGRLAAGFRAAAGRNGEAEWRGLIGPPSMMLAREARAADLIVTGAPADPDAANGHAMDFGDLLLDAGRPVIVAADGATRLAGERIVVAWKDCREARRAVRDALPLLARARDVLVISVDDPGRNNAREGIEDVAAFLARHGVRARTEVIDDAGGAPGERIAETARSLDADLVVSGAYGSSRLREWVFGGVTRSLLARGEVNRLMSN